MQTRFSDAQLANPLIREADAILRKCVHCGFCTATCPTYVLSGDELDSPRGRIYLIKDMLENDRVAPSTVRRVDRCLSCLSCKTTCPSGVEYGRLADLARHRIAKDFRRPASERLLRGLLGFLIPRAGWFRLALSMGRLVKPFAVFAPTRLQSLLAMTPKQSPPKSSLDRPQVFAAHGARKMRVALLTGCAQKVLAPQINKATARILARHGCEVVVAKGAGCCGALSLHMGDEAAAKTFARANVQAWERESERGGLDAIIITASGCGSAVKDYGRLLQDDPLWSQRAQWVAGLARDVSEILRDLDMKPTRSLPDILVAYHAPCSLQHGQRLGHLPLSLLQAAGFRVAPIPEGHLCCGSAGTYNLLQPKIASALGARKAEHIRNMFPDLVATGNIGCLTQIQNHTTIPVTHTVELLDWATGGPAPEAMKSVR